MNMQIERLINQTEQLRQERTRAEELFSERLRSVVHSHNQELEKMTKLPIKEKERMTTLEKNYEVLAAQYRERSDQLSKLQYDIAVKQLRCETESRQLKEREEKLAKREAVVNRAATKTADAGLRRTRDSALSELRKLRSEMKDLQTKHDELRNQLLKAQTALVEAHAENRLLNKKLSEDQTKTKLDKGK